jgi:flagellar protein FliT
MQALDIIPRLERALAESLAMLTAAQDGRWDDLLEMETARRNWVVEASRGEASVGSDVLVPRKKELIRDILAADAQIRVLTQAWMGELQSVLTSVQVERKLIRAYESR